MNAQEICRALGERVIAQVQTINEMLGKNQLYLTSDLGLYHLYSNASGRDVLLMEGRNSIGDLVKLLSLLGEIRKCVREGKIA